MYHIVENISVVLFLLLQMGLAICFHGKDNFKIFSSSKIFSNMVVDFFISIVVHYVEIFHCQNHLLLSLVPLQLPANRCVGKVVIYCLFICN